MGVLAFLEGLLLLCRPTLAPVPKTLAGRCAQVKEPVFLLDLKVLRIGHGAIPLRLVQWCFLRRYSADSASDERYECTV
jgi:hypothetical protein